MIWLSASLGSVVELVEVLSLASLVLAAEAFLFGDVDVGFDDDDEEDDGDDDDDDSAALP